LKHFAHRAGFFFEQRPQRERRRFSGQPAAIAASFRTRFALPIVRFFFQNFFSSISTAPLRNLLDFPAALSSPRSGAVGREILKKLFLGRFIYFSSPLVRRNKLPAPLETEAPASGIACKKRKNRIIEVYKSSIAATAFSQWLR